MTIYEVNLALDAEIADEFAAWLGPHIREVVSLDGFLSAEWFEVESDDGTKVRWCVQYRLKSRTALETYFVRHAERMRREGLDRFGGRFEADRRILLRKGSVGAEIAL